MGLSRKIGKDRDHVNDAILTNSKSYVQSVGMRTLTLFIIRY